MIISHFVLIIVQLWLTCMCYVLYYYTTIIAIDGTMQSHRMFELLGELVEAVGDMPNL